MIISEDTWAHVGILGACFVPIILSWLDNRHQRHKQHLENQTRLTRIETILEPIWNWWNKTNGSS